MEPSKEHTVRQRSGVLGWSAILLGVIGVVVYGFSLRVIPASARRAALEGADPFAVQTSFWVALLMIFAATLALALLSLRKAADRLVPGIGVGFGIVGLLLVLSSYVTFYFFR
ncbi:hypothetical protein [Glutamicibacter creatinolyticus]|uniref:hypothetical protein n=1 Tax=Glutamicibacter creatinolyticus TaxID=162496 RepID=UPI0037BF8A75